MTRDEKVIKEYDPVFYEKVADLNAAGRPGAAGLLCAVEQLVYEGKVPDHELRNLGAALAEQQRINR